MTRYGIGVDLGGTNLRAAAVDAGGTTLARISWPTASHRDGILDSIVAGVREVRSKVGAAGLAGIGIGVPGFIQMKTGVVAGSANLPGFDGFPVRDAIEDRLGTAIILENDANVAALGEKWIGAGTDVDDLILITLGTGIGGGIIVGGKVLHGAMGMAGEIGHMTVYPDGNPCGCGNRGCLEKHASATAIVGMARIAGLGEPELTSEEVYQLAVAGNEGARCVFDAMGRALGIGLSTLINIFNFPLYLLSGGPLPAWELFAPAMFEEVRRRSFTFSRTKTRIERAALGSDAGLIGAAYLPLERARAELDTAVAG